MDAHFQHETQRIDQKMPLSAAYFLADVVAAWSPFSVVLTVWLSKIPALGSGS
jgi:hypothetical protein